MKDFLKELVKIALTTMVAVLIISAAGFFMLVHESVDHPQQQQNHAYIAKLNCYCRRTTTDRGVYLINEHQDTVAFIYHPHKIIEWTQP
jgi:translation elongation factor EF-1alpha